MSPFLFNIYLEEALKSCPKLWQAVQKGNLLAFADDLLIMNEDSKELCLLIKELESLEKDFGLKLNK